MVSHRRVSGVAIVAFVSMTVALAATSCRCTKTETEPERPDDAGLALESDGAGELDSERRDGSLFDAGQRFFDASPRAASHAGGPLDPVCTGPEISFAVAVVDERCAIGSPRAKALRAALEGDGGVALALRQEAKAEPDGRISLRMINTGSVPLTLPLSWSAKLPSFTVLAQDEHHAIFELAPPHFEPSGASGGGGDASARSDRAHFARIVLPPGGAAMALLTLDTAVTKELTPRRRDGSAACRDGGACAPSRLTRGRYVLHIGELFTDVEAGPPARVPWVVP